MGPRPHNLCPIMGEGCVEGGRVPMKNIKEHDSESQTSFAHQSDIPRPLTSLSDMFAQWVLIIRASRNPNMVRRFRAKDVFCQNKFCAKWRTSKNTKVSHILHLLSILTSHGYLLSILVNDVACSITTYFKGVSNHFLLTICIAVSHRTILCSEFCERFVSFLLMSELWDISDLQAIENGIQKIYYRMHEDIIS